jgi:hypothetical protein
VVIAVSEEHIVSIIRIDMEEYVPPEIGDHLPDQFSAPSDHGMKE